MACEAPFNCQLGLSEFKENLIEEQPDLKKPKLESAEEEEDGEVIEGEYVEVPMEVREREDWWVDDDFYADNEAGLHEMNPKEMKLYMDHVNKSHGFDVPDFPNAIFYGIQPCNEAFSNDWVYWEVKECSIFATQERNKIEGTNYVFYRLVKVNVEIVSGSIYYITFLAEDLKRLDSGGSGSGNLEMVHFGQKGGRLVELRAKVYYPIPDKEDNVKMELMYFDANDTLSEEGLEAHMELLRRLAAATK